MHTVGLKNADAMSATLKSVDTGLSTPSEELLLALFKAYERGGAPYVPEDRQEKGAEDRRHAADPDQDIFSLGDVSPEQQRLFAKGKYYCNQSRSLAVRGDALSAWQFIALAGTFFQKITEGDELKLLARSELLSAEAAIEYQSRNYPGSHERLAAARATDRQLVEEFGQTGSLAHGFHLITKQVQLESAQRGFVDALRIAAAGLLVLSGRMPQRPVALWPLSPGSETGLPPGMRRILSRQLTIEVGATFLFVPPDSRAQLMGEFGAEIGAQHGTLDIEDAGISQIDLEWLRAKLISIDQRQTTAHLHACAAFLEKEGDDIGLLRHMCALDAADRCLSFEHPLALEFRKRVFTDLSKVLSFPLILRNRWSRLTENLTNTSLTK